MQNVLESRVYRTLSEIPAENWDNLNTINDVFHTHLFLSDLERAKVEKAENWYLMLYSNGKLVCTAVVSSFVINLDIFLQAGSFVNAVRKLWPGFLKVKVLMCGAPASLGQKNILLATGSNSKEILETVAGFMNNIAKQNKIRYLAFKEFRENETADFDHLSALGYFKAHSLPYMKLQIEWKTFGSYLESLRHGYKRQILLSLKKIKINAHFEFAHGESLLPSTSPFLILSNAKICTPELFYASYLAVMDRATSKLETLNLAFFQNFFKSHGEHLVFLILADPTNIHGCAILVPHGNELTFALLGKTDEKDDYDTYFNLISGIVKYAIEHNYATVNMGQTSYYPKSRMGAKPEGLFVYFKSNLPHMHFLLKALRKVIFPELKIQKLDVFTRT